MGEYERQVLQENPRMLDRHLEVCRDRFERGEYEFAVQAVRLCLHFGAPIPEWLEGEVYAAMQFYLAKGGASKRGAKGNLAQSRSARIDVERYRVVERERDRGFTKSQAIERASKRLVKTRSQGSIGQIEDSYDRVAPRYQSKRRKPGPKPIPSNSPP